MSVKRGDIYYADLSPVVGSEQGGLRPVLIIQNDVGNRYSPTVIAAAITSRLGKNRLPTHIDVYADRVGLVKDSVILLEQVRTLDKRRLKEKMGHLDEHMMEEVNRAIAVSVGLGDWQPALPSPTHGLQAAAVASHLSAAASTAEQQEAPARPIGVAVAADAPTAGIPTTGMAAMAQPVATQAPAAMQPPQPFTRNTPADVATPDALQMGAELNTQSAASPEFGEVIDGERFWRAWVVRGEGNFFS